ncbi:MAG TPA: tRNA uridine-5-carboxymethylaminomethyl(34) synthesis GTPase MnmE, partial [Candidatus Blautia excrementigallinarum]|nr:tRNA uridine-5-carboxymethylaminomethyl(34) synthesis GTPase MnmE [Candidatus Blautia excrementigallinarum]
GRLDLSQAEAVMDVIQAKSAVALKSSLQQLKGSVLRAIKEIRSSILYQIAFIESALDDPEHISLEGYPEKLRKIVDEEYEKVETLLKSADDGRMIQEGIKTVILGKPNAGKSSLLNFLVGEDRAIVTDIAGTTRDTLEEYISLHGISLRIIDTAGIRETEDVVEKIGVGKAKKMAEDADLILYVVDSSLPLDENDREIMELLGGRKSIVIYNKTDLESVVDIKELKEKTGSPVIPVSVVEETGITELEETIKKMFFRGEISFDDEVYITNARHKTALEEALESLKMVRESIETGMSEDFFSIDLMSAYESLGKIVGESVGEDLVNEIFSRFCVGK